MRNVLLLHTDDAIT